MRIYSTRRLMVKYYTGTNKPVAVVYVHPIILSIMNIVTKCKY